MCFQLLQDLGSLKIVTGQGKTVHNIMRCFRILTLMYQKHCNQSRQIIHYKYYKLKLISLIFSVHLNKPDNVHSRILHTNQRDVTELKATYLNPYIVTL